MALSVVTGGTGFVGRHLVRALQKRGDKIRILDITSPPPDLLQDQPNTEFLKTDITDPESVNQALSSGNVQTVFHVASVVHTKQNQEDFVRAVNLGGTVNIIQACQSHKISRLVYVSSGSVVYEGNSIENGDESLPLATTKQAPYAETKILAEKEVLKSASDTLRTISLRPHVIFGPEDGRMIPAVIRNSKAGKIKYQVGRGEWLSDFTYISNLIDALLLADEKLGGENWESVSGKAYFITNGEPIPFWDFCRKVLKRLDLPPIVGALPHQPILVLAHVREWFDTHVRGGTISPEDGFTPFAIRYMCTHHYFSIENAKKDLGYDPKVSLDEGIELTCKYIEENGGV